MREEKLIVFVKNLEPGKVKTRLAADLGEEAALDIYRRLLNFTREQMVPLKAEKEIWYSDFVNTEDNWEEGDFIKKLQSGKDLGERMSGAFYESIARKQSGQRKTILIGSDCGELSTFILEKAFQKLEDHDLVLGPATDGGYYLIGMKSYYPMLFKGISWSSPEVLNQTLKIADELKLSLYLLPELNDVDTAEDWELLQNSQTIL